ncbi:MAG: hypothetical protein ACJAT2_001445 [Bacteriovoracaceae bacterium]|jgi:hypothetical protein
MKLTTLTAALIALSLSTSAVAAKHDVNIKFSKGISKKQRKFMDRDLEVLEKLEFFRDADQETLKVMGLEQLNSKTATDWLEKRVAYVIEETDWKKIEKKLSVEEKFFSFENQSIEPTIERATSAPTGKGVVVMSNLGAALYYAGKSSRSLLSYPIKTGLFKKEKVKFSSPRAGLIMIGEGHFMDRFDHDQDNKDAKANSFGRLSTFFHEARHSDGAGKNLGFFHAVCPDGHDFQGYNACDRNLNGPYAVGAQMTKEFLKNCDDCDDVVKEKMKVSYLASVDRIIKETKKPGTSHSADVTSLEFTLEMKELLLSFQEGAEREATMKEITELKAKILAISESEGTIVTTASQYIDASPEGERID